MDWKVMMLSFGMLFLAEIGDKTQLAVFTLVSQYKSPLSVFLGASLALIAVTLIGAVFGGLVSRYVPILYVRVVAGVLFVAMGLLTLWQAWAGSIS